MTIPTDITPAATVVLLRDAPAGVEVFLMRRHAASGFMAGATVFPGGKVDAEDRTAHAAGRTPRSCGQVLGASDDAAAWAQFVAAARELHEESHVLLATAPDGKFARSPHVQCLDTEIETARIGHRLAAAAWHAAARRLGLVLTLDRLTPFARWITPTAEPRRFDATFYCATLPDHQDARLDPHEASAAAWHTPAAALADHASGGPMWLPPPTLHTLSVLARAGDSAAEIVAHLTAPGAIPLYAPEFVSDTPDGPAIVLPGDPLHPFPVPPIVPAAAGYRHLAAGLATRYVLREGRFAACDLAKPV